MGVTIRECESVCLAITMLIWTLMLASPLIQTALAQSEDQISSLAKVIPGIPGEDFPIYGELPSTSFLCDERVPGYYADPEADCQLFHICVDEDQLTPPLTDYTFLCPNGTIFSQQYFVCDWWFNVDCSVTESFYSLNELLFE